MLSNDRIALCMFFFCSPGMCNHPKAMRMSNFVKEFSVSDSVIGDNTRQQKCDVTKLQITNADGITQTVRAKSSEEPAITGSHEGRDFTSKTFLTIQMFADMLLKIMVIELLLQM